MIQLEVWGPYALIARPELKVERVSYDVLTPSAARGIVDSIYYHPGLHWYIDRIHVLAPIRFVSVRRNEVSSKISARNAEEAMRGKRRGIYLDASNDSTQRSSLMLRDVHYVIEAHFEMTDKAAPSDNPDKFQAIITRRMENGQCYNTPYFGCRECSVFFRRWPGGPIPAIPETRDLGLMLYDFDYTDPKHIVPTYFRAKLVNGVLDVRDCEVFR